MPAAPLLRLTSTHACASTSGRYTLSYKAWNLRVDDRLAARYSVLWSSRTPRYRVSLALWAFTSASPFQTRLRFFGSFPQVELYCLDPASGIITRSDSLSPNCHFVGLTYRQSCSGEEGLPSSLSNILSIPRPLRRRLLPWCCPGSSHVPWPSPIHARFGCLWFPCGLRYDAADFALCCGLESRQFRAPACVFHHLQTVDFRASWYLP